MKMVVNNEPRSLPLSGDEPFIFTLSGPIRDTMAADHPTA